MPPLVSVIIPVYNGAKYLPLAIESVLNQSFDGYELIVVDDGSTDETPVIAQSYGQRLRYTQQKNAGAGAAFNRGIRMSSGDYLSWLSHDDVYAERKLEMQVKALQERGVPAACYTDVEEIDSLGKPVGEWLGLEYQPVQVLRHVIGLTLSSAAYSLFYDRRCLHKAGLYDESLRYTQDADMLLKLALHYPLIHVPEKLMRVREHVGRGVRSSVKNWQRECFRFYRSWLNRLSLNELFPELGETPLAMQRANARLWLGDRFAKTSFPLAWLALGQYRAALGESLAVAPEVSRRCARMWLGIFWPYLGPFRSLIVKIKACRSPVGKR